MRHNECHSKLQVQVDALKIFVN